MIIMILTSLFYYHLFYDVTLIALITENIFIKLIIFYYSLIIQTLFYDQVFVLAKITPSSYKKMSLPMDYPPLPVFNPNPFCSNVYSIGERILLAWLNHHYEQQRSKCWKQQHKNSGKLITRNYTFFS